MLSMEVYQFSDRLLFEHPFYILPDHVGVSKWCARTRVREKISKNRFSTKSGIFRGDLLQKRCLPKCLCHLPKFSPGPWRPSWGGVKGPAGTWRDVFFRVSDRNTSNTTRSEFEYRARTRVRRVVPRVRRDHNETEPVFERDAVHI